ncbi:uncharacterized protein LOC143594223 [Bidens hawaiensis]|uniref:uncharacterized protein LOC143594223 n=1 Tax=Bidens hawaiensis TaxID=980011 RepID=UPI004049D107
MSDKETTKTGSGSGSGNPNAFQSHMLTSTNYTIWAIRMKVLLNVHKVWNIIDPSATDDDKNNIAIALIYQSILEATIMQVGNLDSAKKIWNTIKTCNLGADQVKEAILQTLMNEFDGMRMKETETIDEFVAKLSCTTSKAGSLGEMIEETMMVKKFLSSLPRNVVGRLKAYGERIQEEDMHSETQGKLMFQRSESSSSRYNDRESTRGVRGRGGGRGCGGRELGQDRGHQENAMNRGNRGHKGKTWDLSKKVKGEAKLAEASETRDPALFMMKCVQETVFLNENKVIPINYESRDGDEWYLDNDASSHMTSNKSFFSELNNRVMGKAKDEAFKVFKKFKELVESDVGKKIKTFRTDRGGEFT